MLHNTIGGMGIGISAERRYEDAHSNVISATRGVGVKLADKKRYEHLNGP